jgi:hypothetical protein
MRAGLFYLPEGFLNACASLSFAPMPVTMNDAFIVFIATGRVAGVASYAPVIFFLNFHRAIHTPVLAVGLDCSRRRQGKGEHHQAKD